MNNSFKAKLLRFFATGFYISYLPGYLFGFLNFKKNTGAGLFGTILAVPFTLLLPSVGWQYFIFLVLFCVFSVWVSDKVTFDGSQKHDNPKIVIDEIAGFWVAMMFSAPNLPNLITAFILFRLLDTLKILGIRRLDSLPGGLGIVADDVGAGLYVFAFMQLAMPYIRNML